MVEIDKAMRFVVDKLERDTVPINIRYSLASIAASMNRIANAFERQAVSQVNLYGVEGKLGELTGVLRELRDRTGSGETYPKTNSELSLRSIDDTLANIHGTINVLIAALKEPQFNSNEG
jgi:hypothetical protein